MKNILIENMLRFGTKNLSKSAKLILQEQDNNAWKPYVKYGNADDGSTGTFEYRKVYTDTLKDASGKEYFYIGQPNNKVTLRAEVVGRYVQSGAYADNNPNLKSTDKKYDFSYNIKLILQPATQKSIDPVAVYNIIGTNLANGKFQIITNYNQAIADWFSKLGNAAWESNLKSMHVASTEPRTSIQGFFSSTFSKSPGTYFTPWRTINTELAKLGYPEFPSVLQQGAVTV
jgi:hypothetical protein